MGLMFRRLGFEELVLLDEDATRMAIEQLVMATLETMLGPDDSLVLFYAGHSSTHLRRIGGREVKTGYLIPTDASREMSTWIDLESWLHRVSMLPARHILVILDAYSGISLDLWLRRRRLDVQRHGLLSGRSTRPSRQILTSARDDEVTLDHGPAPGYSLFTGCVIDSLTYLLGRGHSRVTTGSELGRYVQQRVRSYPGSRQTPDFGTFDLDEWGEMVLPSLDQPLEAATATPARADFRPRGGRDVERRSAFETPLTPETDAGSRAGDRRRTVDLQLEQASGGESSWIRRTTILQRNKPYVLRVSIGLPLRGTLLAKAPPSIDDILEHDSTHELEAVVFGLGFQVIGPVVQRVTLPQRGPTEPVVFELRAERTGTVRARVVLYARNQALQSFVVSAKVGAVEQRGLARTLSAELEFSRAADLDRLDRFEPRIASFAVNADATGTHSFMVKGRGSAASVASVGASGLAKLERELRGELARAAKEMKGRLDEGIIDDPASMAFRQTFHALAHGGQSLYYALAERIPPPPADPGVLETIASSSGETIQIVRFDLDYAFPWRMLYDFDLPPHRLGQNKKTVLPAEVCLGGTDCNHLVTRDGYCVRGFWGIRHVVEELLAKGSQNEERKVASPGLARGIHVALGFRDEFAREIEDEAKRALGPSARSLDPGKSSMLDTLWDDQQRPAQLIVYSHLETKDLPDEEDGRRVLFMTGKKREFLLAQDVTRRWLRAGRKPWSEPRTVIFLMACSSISDDDLLSDFAKSFHSAGAAAIVGVEVPIFESLMSRFARQVTRDWWIAQKSLGEAIRGFRYELMSTGNPLGLVFNVLGNADLEIK